MVRQPSVSIGDRAGRAGRRHGALPGHAHVHHVGPPEDRHEGRWASVGTGPVAQEGNVNYQSRTWGKKSL